VKGISIRPMGGWSVPLDKSLVSANPRSNEHPQTPASSFHFRLFVQFNSVRDEGSVSHQSAVARLQQPSHCWSHRFADPFSMRSLNRRRIAHTLHQRTEDRHMDQQPAEEVAVCGSPGVSSTALDLVPTLGLWRGGDRANGDSGLHKQRMTRQH
jgi:hypothetical protein